jgi:hypothetical protein
MFSANENLALRQHKRRIVQRVEQTMPQAALDMGTTVMVMQVSCKAPGCVPLETAIIIIFPPSTSELVPGLKESKGSNSSGGGGGGSFKTKILKPMADVDDEDILDALPPAFDGGRRSMERLCIRARDVMIAQITQLFGEDATEKDDRRAMALYLQQCLKQYIDRDCIPPELDQPYNSDIPVIQGEDNVDDENVSASVDETKQNGNEYGKDDGNNNTTTTISTTTTTTTTIRPSTKIPSTGNIVIHRGKEYDSLATSTQVPNSASATTSTVGNTITKSIISSRPVPLKHQRAVQQALISSSSNISSSSSMNNATIAQFFEREHAPGIRQAGCPCCDPENPSALIERMMML